MENIQGQFSIVALKPFNADEIAAEKNPVRRLMMRAKISASAFLKSMQNIGFNVMVETASGEIIALDVNPRILQSPAGKIEARQLIGRAISEWQALRYVVFMDAGVNQAWKHTIVVSGFDHKEGNLAWVFESMELKISAEAKPTIDTSKDTKGGQFASFWDGLITPAGQRH